MSKLQTLQRRHPRFIYEKYSYALVRNDLRASFLFRLEPNISFRPTVTIKGVDRKRVRAIGDRVLRNLVFHLGLMEIPSYWKATCSPEIVIRAGALDASQIRWWKNLMLNGMGQFFYENNIDFRTKNFLTIRSTPPIRNNKAIVSIFRMDREGSAKRVLVPMGGGKDSIVTFEILRKHWKHMNAFSLNPTKATQKILKVAGAKNSVIVQRTIDPALFKLNRKGYLNGHTPFSAYLAFLSVVLGVLFDYKYLAFSNERSSNEGNVQYLRKTINHQWSKSFVFETAFRKYTKRYLAKDIEYFSFLRPLYELQIARLFSRYPKYFQNFLSCNEAHKTDSGRKRPSGKWCGYCPKCLAIFAYLYPFVEESQVIKIFGRNLFMQKQLIPLMKELIGERGFKPFECVGTIKENRVAFYLSAEKADRAILHLLDYFRRKLLPKYRNIEKDTWGILSAWDQKHHIPREFKAILRQELST